MSAPSCVAGNLCIMKDRQGKQLPLSSSMKHFCLRCGHQKHAPCGHEYSEILKNENEFKDILDVIAPRKKNDKGEEVGDRPTPKPVGEMKVSNLKFVFSVLIKSGHRQHRHVSFRSAEDGWWVHLSYVLVPNTYIPSPHANCPHTVIVRAIRPEHHRTITMLRL